MDTNLIYAKTPSGDEAVRQSTRVVQRNLRMVLVQVDGKMSVQELSIKIGNRRLVEAALRELEEGGYIVPTQPVASAWETSTTAALDADQQEASQPMSQFSVFGAKPAPRAASEEAPSKTSNFSSFGKPIFPTTGNTATSGFKPSMLPPAFQPEPEDLPDSGKTVRLTRRHLWLGALAALLLAAGAVFLYPYERFKPGIEASASNYLGSPVQVGGIALALYPTPHLKLTGVSFLNGGDGHIAEIRVASPFALLVGGAQIDISRVDVIGANFSPKQLVALPFFRRDGGKTPGMLIRKIRLEHGELVLAQGVSLSGIYGELSFGNDGGLEKAVFENNDRSLQVDAQAEQRGIALKIEGRSWKPAGTSAVFASLQAKGVLQADKLLVQNIDTTFLGGMLRGNWLIDWGNDLAMAGDGTLSRIDLRKLGSAFVPSLKMEGEMSGAFKLRANGRSWDGLWRNVEAVLSTEISRGTLQGVDLGEAVRRNGVSDVRGGATKFDWLRLSVSVTPKQVISKDIRMDAGMLTATGQFSAERDGRVEGNMAVTLQSSVSKTNVPVRIYGTLPDLTVIGRK